MTDIRVVIVDDEPLTRERVRSLVETSEGLALVGEGSNGLEALDLITTLEPDLIFIDVEMPELDGFGVIAALDIERMPAVIFITAYEHYALQAFEVGAVDYLHKPVTPARFAAAVARARERLDRPSPAHWDLLVAGATRVERARGKRARFVVKRGSSHYFVPVEEVDWIDVADNYLRLHTGSRVQFTRGTMKSAEDELDPERFVRVHRSAMVAIDRIRSVRTIDGVQVVELTTGVQLRCSRQYSRRVGLLLR